MRDIQWKANGAGGGVAFEFADEWWKNYDNPRRAGDWWNRGPAPDDVKTDDLDREEHYGLVTADRQPKAAFEVVRPADGDKIVDQGKVLSLREKKSDINEAGAGKEIGIFVSTKSAIKVGDHILIRK